MHLLPIPSSQLTIDNATLVSIGYSLYQLEKIANFVHKFVEIYFYSQHIKHRCRSWVSPFFP